MPQQLPRMKDKGWRLGKQPRETWAETARTLVKESDESRGVIDRVSTQSFGLIDDFIDRPAGPWRSPFDEAALSLPANLPCGGALPEPPCDGRIPRREMPSVRVSIFEISVLDAHRG